MTPFDLAYQRPFPYEKLAIFGTTGDAINHIQHVKLKKMDKQTQSAIYLGYSIQSDDYLVLWKINNFTSRTTTFTPNHQHFMHRFSKLSVPEEGHFDLTNEHQATSQFLTGYYLTPLMNLYKPKSFFQIRFCKDQIGWLDASDKELHSLESVGNIRQWCRR